MLNNNSNWTTTTIGEVYKFTSKPRGLDKFSEVTFIPMEAISDKSEFLNKSLIKKVKNVSSGTYVENGDLILAKITPSFENGKQAIVNIDESFAYATTEVIPIQEIENISDKWFLAYWLKQGDIRTYLAGKMEGTTGRQRLSKKVLSDSIINLPSLGEQKKIVKVLASIQTSIFEQDKLILKLKELKRGMLQQLFTHGTRGEKTKVTDIGEIPESWDLITVKEAIDRSIIEKPIDGNHGNIHPKSKDFVDSGIPFIMASDLIGNSVDIKECHFISKSQADKLLKGFSLEGDVLLSHKATIGRTAIVHSLTTEYLMLTPQVTYYRVKDKNKLQNYFLRHFFDSSGFQSTIKNIAGDGSTRAYIGILKQQILPIVLPPLDEQIKITKSLDVLDDRIESANMKLLAYQALFKTLLHELMNGKRRTN